MFAAEATAEDGVVRCTYCGSTDVRPKGRKPRLKRYRDEENRWQTVEVYRYRCRNPECPYGSFIPFTEDAQPRIRGRCPLELAGYDISGLPMAQVCCG